MIPTGVLTPYNAQATLHMKVGFFALLLPIAVDERVSDIWRSYFAQRLFWDTGLKVGFMTRPLVVQDQNQQNHLGDLEAERDLHMKSGQLVEFLGSWRGNGKMLVEQMKNCGLYFMKSTTLNSMMWSLSFYGCNVSLNAYKFPELNFKTAVSSPKYHQSNATRGLL